MAIRGSMRDHLGGDVGAGAGAVLDDEGLPQALRQPLTDQPRMDVGDTTGRAANDDAHRPRWISLCARNARHCRQRGSARRQMQELPSGKVHVARLLPALMLPARIPLALFSVSSAMSLLKSDGEPTNAVPPSSASRALILGSARPALTSLLSCLMISVGVFLGAPIATNALASKPGRDSPNVDTCGS